MRDLRSPRWIVAKAALFLVMGVTAGALVWADHPDLRTAVLLVLAIWAFCRAYYFVFYVIEKYVDPGYRFSGLGSALRYLLQRRAGK